MPDTLRPRCSVCGFSWDWGRDDAIGMVAESPELYALALEDVGGIGAGALAGAADHLWRMVDTLRFGTERLWWLAHDPDATPPAVDAEALARLRPPGSRSVAVGLVAYRHAAAAWVEAARDLAPDDGPGTAMARDAAHDAQHRLLEMERLVRPPSDTLYVAGAVPAGGDPAGRSGGGRLFDDYVMVDWSANSSPRTGRDSIWLARGSWTDGALATPVPTNPATRAEAMAQIHAVVTACLGAGRRLLLGFDFPLAYPAGLTALFPGVFGPGPPWRAVWRTLAERIEDKADNANNRWDVATELNRATGHRLFWGCPEGVANPSLGTKDKPLPGLAERPPHLATFRLTERRAQGVGGSIQSVWKLAYAGSVGSQALLGIPHLEALRTDFEGRVGVWPLETGLGGSAPVTVAEIWPTIFPVDLGRHPVRDAAQVMTVVDHVAGADAAGELAAWLAPALDPDSAGPVAEEGWILGVR